MPTALELGREGWKPYIRANRQPAQSELTIQQQERDQLLERVRKVAHCLKKQFGARRVLIFGSLAHAGWFAKDSDVDLAVEGIAGDDFWEAWRLAEEIVGDRPVDLIDIEMAGKSLTQSIDRYGVEL